MECNRVSFAVGQQFDRPTPPFTNTILTKFGKNPYGQNIYRIVWSETVLEQVGGLWHDHIRSDEESHFVKEGNFIKESNPTISERAEYRWVPRYPGVARWILEKWLPPAYSRSEWYSRFADPSSGLCYLGPYLERGDYHHCYRLEYRGQFMPLTLAVVEYYARLIEAGKEFSAVQRRLAIEQRQAQQKRDWENRVDAIFDDCQPAFGVTRLMSGYGPKSAARTKPEDVTFGDADKLPEWVPKTAGFHQI